MELKGKFGTRNLSEKLGGHIEIRDVKFGEGDYGSYAILTLSDNKKYRTWSKFVIEQLRERVVNWTKTGKIVGARLSERISTKTGRKYYDLWEIRAVRY